MINVNDLDKICRICLNITNSELLISHSNILSMLTACSSLKYLDNNLFPKKICIKCKQNLENVYEFNLLCETSNSALYKLLYNEDKLVKSELENSLNNGIIYNINEFPAKDLKAETEDKKEIVIKSIIQLYEKEDADNNISNFDSESDDDKIVINNDQTSSAHLNEIDIKPDIDKITQLQLKVCKEGKITEPRNNYKERLSKVKLSDKCDVNSKTCLICNKKLVNIHSLARHMELHEENRKIVAVCEICSRPFYDTGYLKRHMLRHTGQARYKCEYCSKKFYELNAFAKHLKRSHKSMKPKNCDLCGKEFWVQLQLDAHRRLHTSELVCDKCNKSFASLDHLRRHKITHIKTKWFSCLLCDKSFKHEMNLLAHHKRIHENKKKRYVCNMCGKSVPYLKRHIMKVHSTERSFKCDQCSKAYQLPDELKNHIKKVHTKLEQMPVKKFLCQECGLPCDSRANLVVHNRIHTGERPYACSLCDKRYRNKGHLNLHLNSHTGTRPFSCPECKKAFFRKPAMINHMRIHTGEKPFSCRVCGKAFSHDSTLWKHSKIHEKKHNKHKEQQPYIIKIISNGDENEPFHHDEYYKNRPYYGLAVTEKS